MSRSLLGRLRLAAFGMPSSPDDPDRVLVGLCRDLAGTVSALQIMLSTDGRDTDVIPGFNALANREAALVRHIAALPASTLIGVVAKAQGALLRPEVRGFDGAQALALSAAEDLVRLAAGPESPLSDNPSLPPETARAVLLSGSTMPKEHIMNSLFDSGRRSSVHGRDVARGALIGLLGELGAGSVVSGVALLIGRPDLPRPFPAALVLFGLGVIALAVMCLRRVTRP